MTPEDNSLESGYDSSPYSSSLEGQQGGVSSSTGPKLPNKAKRLNISLFKFNRVAGIATVIALVLIFLVGGLAFAYDKLHHSSNNTVNSVESSGNYKVGSSISVQQASESQLLQLGQVNQLQVNGQLKVSQSLILTPTKTTPSNPKQGEIYFNQLTDQPYYYNGSQFVSLGKTDVSSLGGTTGAIGLGNSLSISGGTLSVSAGLLQSVASAATSGSRVNSLQGQTGNVTFTAGPGIAINGTDISNSGVVNLTSSNGSISISNSGNGNYDITLAAGGAVALGPVAAQVDNSNNPSIFISKGSGYTGDLLDLQNDGSPSFVVDQSGDVTNYGNFLQSGTGTFDTGTGTVDLNGNTYVKNGNSLEVTGSTTLDGALGVTDLSTLTGGLSTTSISDSGGAGITGNTTIGGTLGVQDALSLGDSDLSDLQPGEINFANSGNSDTDMLDSLAPSGGDAVIQLPGVAAGTYTVCVFNNSYSNCGGNTDTVTAASPTEYAIPEFGTGDTLINSPVTDNDSDITIGNSEGLVVDTIQTNSITSTTGLTLGTSSQELDLEGNDNSSIVLGSTGNATTINFTPSSSADETITFPDTYAAVGSNSGTVCLEGSTSCGFATAHSGVQELTANGVSLIGDITIQNAQTVTTGGQNAIAINQAASDGSTYGIATFNSADFTGTGVISTIQGIGTGATVQFASLSLDTGSACATGNLCLNSSGTVNAANITNSSTGSSSLLKISSGTGSSSNIEFYTDNSTNSFLFPTGGGLNQTLCVTGSTCAIGSGQAVILSSSTEQNTISCSVDCTPALWINQINSGTDLVDLQAGGNDALVIDGSGDATFDNTLTVDGTLSTGQISPTSSGGTLTLGTTSGQTLLKDNAAISDGQVLQVANGSNTSYLEFYPNGGTPSSGTQYYALDTSEGGTSSATNPIYICTSGNTYCSGSASGVLAGSGGNTNYIPIFTEDSLNGESIGDSTFQENIVGGFNDLDDDGQLTVGDTTSVPGNIIINNGSNSDSVTLTQPTTDPGGPIGVDLPSQAGYLVDSATGLLHISANGVISCPDCSSDGGGGGGATEVTSLNGLQDDVVIETVNGGEIAPSGQDIIIPTATSTVQGLASFNSTDLPVSGGVVDTGQSLSTTADDTFGGLNLSELGSDTLTLGNNSDDGTLVFDDGSGNKTTINQATITGSGVNQKIALPYNSNCDTSGNCTFAVQGAPGGNISVSTSGSTQGTISISNSPTFSTSVTTPELLGDTLVNSGELQIGSESNQFELQGLAGTNSSDAEILAYSSSSPSSNYTTINFASPTGTPVITFPAATGYVCIYNPTTLTATDCPSSGLTGSGYSANQVAFFNNSSVLTSSNLFTDNGTNIGVNIGTGFGAYTDFMVNAAADAIANASTQLNSGISTNIALVVQGASSQSADILDIDNNSGSVLDGFNSSGNLALNSGTLTSTASTVNLLNDSTAHTINLGNTTGATALNLYAGSGGITLENNTTADANLVVGTSSQLTLSSSGTNASIQAASGDGLAIDTAGGTSILSLGITHATTVTVGNTSNTTTNIYGGTVSVQSGSGGVGIGTSNANSIQIGNSSLSSGTQTINIGNNNTSGGTTNINIGNGSTASGAVSIQGSSITLATINNSSTSDTNTTTITGTDSYDSGTNSSLTDKASITGTTSSGTYVVNADSITLTGNSISGSGANILNGISLGSVSAVTGNTFNGIYFGSGYTNGIDFGSSSIGDYINAPQFDITSSAVLQDVSSNVFAFEAGSSSIANFENSSGQTVGEFNATNLTLGSSNVPGNLTFTSSGGASVALAVTSSNAASYTLLLPMPAPTIASTGQCLNASSNPSGSNYQLSYTSCGVSGSHSASIVVPAEYAGAVLDSAGDNSCGSSNIGTLTSGSTGANTSFNSGASPYNQNYYQWTSSQSATECYDIVVQVPLPSDFGSFSGTPTIYAEGSSGSVSVEALTCSGALDSNYSTGYSSVTSPSTLTQESLPSALGSSYTSCGYITLRIRLNTTASGGTAEAGTISIPYTTNTTN